MADELAAILSATLPSQDDAAKLSDVLYQRCYTRSVLHPEEPRVAPESLTEALAAANRSRAMWVEGWKISQRLEDGRIVARRGDAERTFLPGEYITRRGIGVAPKDGSPISVYVSPGSSEIQESFYYAFGETVEDCESQRVVRIYWNVRAEGAAHLMERLTGELNRFQVPFRFKCLNDASYYPRRDAAVLYVEGRYWPILARVVEAVHRDVLPWLNGDTPLFTKRLAHGLALAEDPGDSFGKHRCEILAAAMAASRGRAVEERLAEVRRRLEEHGISWEAPWLNAGSEDGYEFGEGRAVDAQESAYADGANTGTDGSVHAAQKRGLGTDSSVPAFAHTASQGAFIEIAHRLGARLCRDALWSGGRCNWVAGEWDGEVTTWRALSPEVYSGTSGVALFLGRLAAATGDPIVRRTAEGAVRQALSRMPRAGCGLYSGGLGILFAAAEVLGECDEDTIVRQAAPNPATLDIIAGSAGAIGALIHWHRTRGGPRWLETAAAHGDLLLAQADRGDEGWSWRTVGSARRNLTGFSHGTAGIGWALLELWGETGEARFRAAALEAFRYERSSFDAEQRNWPDWREEETRYPAVWCHGAGGIGFSRLRAWQLLGDAESLGEARTALATIGDTLREDRSFGLCHGIAGNADLLLYGSDVLGEAGWREEAETVAREAAARLEGRSAPWPCGTPGAGEVPGLMTGMAGIGYFYMRLADAKIPSMLIIGAEESA